MSTTREAKAFTLPGAVARWGLVVALAFAAFHGPFLAQKYEPNTWLYRDGAFYFTTLRALAEHGRVEQKDLQPRSWYEDRLGWNDRLTDDWSNVALGRDGRWYPKHPILLPLMSVPFYWLFGTPGTLAVNVLLNLAFVLLVFLLARRVARVELAALVAVMVAATPIAQTMSYWYSNDLLSAVLLLGALELALAHRFGLAGVLAGFALWSRVTNATYLPALALVGVMEGGLAGLGAAVRWSLVPLGLFAAFNWWAFGAPWITSYQAVIVREGGAMTTASHSRLFNTPFAKGFRNVVLGPDGAFSAFPLFAPGLAGLAVLARRRGLLAIALLLFSTLQAVVLMKYDWYRPFFLYPAFGASAIGLAALGDLFVGRREESYEPVRIPRGALAIGLGAIVLVGFGFRLATRPDSSLLSSRMDEAKVFLGDVACDYWNPQAERWECSHFDRGEAWMYTGRLLAKPVTVRGRDRRGIWHHPHASGKWRRVVFDGLDGREVELTFALADPTREGEVTIEVLSRGELVETLRMRRAGEEEKRTIALAQGDGPALEVRVRAEKPDWKQLVWDGVVR